MPDAAPETLLREVRLWDDRDEARSGAENMAMDEALLAWAAASAMPVLRVYRWARPTLSFGYFLTLAEAEAAREPGEDLIRRWTGGGLVHHEGTFTWTLAVPFTASFCRLRPGESYGKLHEVLAGVLAGFGWQNLIVVPQQQTAPSGGLCAEAPAPGDLLHQGRKLAGAGQRRTRQGLLHQGVLFTPESTLPRALPVLLAEALAGSALPWADPAVPPPAVPLRRYQDPFWNGLR